MSRRHIENLLEQLEERSNQRRSEAAIMLGELGETEAIPDLIKLMMSQDDSLWLNTENGVPVDTPEHPRVHAYQAVKKMVKLDHLLRNIVHRKHPEIRAGSAYLLGEMEFGEDEQSRISEALHNAISDPDAMVHFEAMRSLGRRKEALLEEIEPSLEANLIRVRLAALRALEHVDDPQVNDILEDFVVDTDESEVLRATAAKILGLRKVTEATRVLMDVLMDESIAVREQAALALGRIGSPAAITPLYQTLIDEDEMVRYAAGVALACIGDDRAVPFVLRAMHHGDQNIQILARQALDGLGKKALKELIKAMQKQPMPYRLDAIEQLGKLKDDSVLIPLLDRLMDEEIYPNVRSVLLGYGERVVPLLNFVIGKDEANTTFKEKCLRILLELDAKSAIPILIALLDDTKSEGAFRELVVRSIGKLAEGYDLPKEVIVETVVEERTTGEGKNKKTEKVELKKEKTTDNIAKEWNVEEAFLRIVERRDLELDEILAEALLGLGKIKSFRAKPHLLEGLQHATSRVRGYSIIALGELGDRSVVDVLIDELMRKSQDNQPLIIQTLSKLGDNRAVDPLFKIIDEAQQHSHVGTKGSYLGAYAVQALAQLKEPRIIRLLLTEWEEELEPAIKAMGDTAIPQLEQVLRYEKNSHIRALAAEGLGVVSDNRSMGLLIESLQDEDGNVQRAAARALNKIHRNQQKLLAGPVAG